MAFFPHSFPSSLQLMETEKEIRSYWGHCVSCGDWNHGEQGAGNNYGSCNLWEDSTAKLYCSLVKEMKWLLRGRNKCPMSAWNPLLSDSSALETLKIKRSNHCSKKDLLECTELHSPGTQHQYTLEGRKGSYSSPVSFSRKEREDEGNPWSCCSQSLISMVKHFWRKMCVLWIVFYCNYCRVISIWMFKIRGQSIILLKKRK